MTSDIGCAAGARMTWFIGAAALVLLLLGFVFVLGLYGDSRWTGVFLLFSGVIGCWLALDVHRLKRHAPDGGPAIDDAPRSPESRDVPGLRTYPLIVGAMFFVVGTLAEDVVVGIIGGLAGLAFGYVATTPIESRRRRRRHADGDDSGQDQIRR
jgi:hypothetical protein